MRESTDPRSARVWRQTVALQRSPSRERTQARGSSSDEGRALNISLAKSNSETAFQRTLIRNPLQNESKLVVSEKPYQNQYLRRPNPQPIISQSTEQVSSRDSAAPYKMNQILKQY
jgi:hypothetical protein